MPNGIVSVPRPQNEPLRDYEPGSPERATLEQRLESMLRERIEIPAIIGGKEVRTGRTVPVVCPHEHGHVLADLHLCGPDEVRQALEAARGAWREWSEMRFVERAAIFLKAADLLAGPWRDTVNAATMLGQSKTCNQAEIDAAAELVDFWRFNPYYAEWLYEYQPNSEPGTWNVLDYRPLEGFVLAVTPFNFTSIGGNLPTSPALMGNVVLWKPATTSALSNYYVMKVLQDAGLPPGVVNFVPARGPDVGDVAFASPELAGLHFTGSTPTFQAMWRSVSENLGCYRNYPRLVGETGGKDFVLAHASADVEALAVALLRGPFEYQGQKCSAASRAYVPSSLWPRLRELLAGMIGEVRMGSPVDFGNFVCAVIDKKAYASIRGYVEEAKRVSGYELIAGGGCDDREGYFIEPTLFRSDDPKSRLMSEEIFGPVLTVFVYDDAKLDETLELCDTTSPYALTGAVFAQDRRVVGRIRERLRHAAGNFYINDKPTGAVVDQQPFGGGRASGTNDKAGSPFNLLRWTSLRTIKETFVPARDWRYPYLG
ncbi:MAG TPA: L-glutamate gamma-semialdehyde dehydrogenase [Thermoanaerobaculia bacterium]|nr:L-glutamate gamma-semialdehyde dehydrogenase [Thermoanaerobaculia bacterium]